MNDKILLIEDDASIIRFLSLSLEKNGYKVIEARNGIEGISLFMTDNPDLILLDQLYSSHFPKWRWYSVACRNNTRYKGTG